MQNRGKYLFFIIAETGCTGVMNTQCIIIAVNKRVQLIYETVNLMKFHLVFMSNNQTHVLAHISAVRCISLIHWYWNTNVIQCKNTRSMKAPLFHLTAIYERQLFQFQINFILHTIFDNVRWGDSWLNFHFHFASCVVSFHYVSSAKYRESPHSKVRK